MLTGIVCILAEVYLTFIYVSAGHSFFSEADKVSIFGMFSYFVLTIIAGGMLGAFEKYGRLKIVMMFVTLLQLGILVFLAFNFVISQELRPIHAKIVLQKKFKNVDFSVNLSSSKSSQNRILSPKKSDLKKPGGSKDLRSYFKCDLKGDSLAVVFPERFKLEQNVKCSGCQQTDSKNFYHVPDPCNHNMYCVNCAVFLLEKVNSCLICNAKIQKMRRVTPDSALNTLKILDVLDFEGYSNLP